jgi:hypothetical protein
MEELSTDNINGIILLCSLYSFLCGVFFNELTRDIDKEKTEVK